MIDSEIAKQIRPGARIRVTSAGAGAGKEGTSLFEGLVLSRKHGTEPGATFTVRATLAGVGVEKIFPLHSPSITKVEIVSTPKKVHRSKLYFIRKVSGKTVRKKLGVSV